MQLSHLEIRGFRNLVDVEIQPSACVNLISGINASGKTSVLEAIYYLSHLRSFRTPNLNDLINNDAQGMRLVATGEDKAGNKIPIGVYRDRHRLEVRANHNNVQRIADITALLPVMAIHPDSYRLISGGPTERRAYIDWGVFHVEHAFFEFWQRYKRALTQRNAALRSAKAVFHSDLWDKELDRAAGYIDKMRKSYLDDMSSSVQQLIKRFFPAQDVRLEYNRGWKSDLSLLEVLRQTQERDRSRGFTQAGPHRADLLIQVDGKSAQTGISRGQQKVLVALLRLAQIQHYTRSANSSCVLLYDDLAAELDEHHRSEILSVLQGMPIQLYLTAIEPKQIDLTGWTDVRLFHVEQGSVSQEHF
jgi:DNA replication and repair protein RecF